MCDLGYRLVILVDMLVGLPGMAIVEEVRLWKGGSLNVGRGAKVKEGRATAVSDVGQMNSLLTIHPFAGCGHIRVDAVCV